MMSETIFDLGFFNGDDTAYYLHKGYNVVALEANLSLYNMGLIRFQKEIESKQLIILNKAFNNRNAGTVDFYIHPLNFDWSTCDQNKTTFWNIVPEICKIETTDFFQLSIDYGVPYYIKCDIEGLDYLLIQQISTIINTINKPRYLSFELSRFDYYKTFSYLYTAGYTEFQLINQTAFDNESHFNFTEYSSGKFGKLLPNKWMNFDECLTRYMKYKELKAIDNKNLALGWVDIHARI